MSSFSRSDATPAYRGYRLQALYTLARIIELSNNVNLVFQPEGEEDLAIRDVNHNLLEVIQVKAYGSNLTLSSLSPNKEDSFFYRVNKLLKDTPSLKISIATFGAVGEEILIATQTDGSHRTKVAQKLSEYRFLSEVEAKRLLTQVQIVSVQEAELTKKVYASLRNCLTGVEPERAFEMLNFWLYVCAENKTKITQRDVIERISKVGQFLAERAAHHREWFTSILPIEDKSVETQKDELSGEFYRGVSARYEHILADVDKYRSEKLSEISQKFKKNKVVIIHGASGQGKTTLAYRYLHDFFPNQWRFQIHLVENRQHALSIAAALAGQAEAIGIPIAVYLDVSPNDIGWVELLEKLAVHSNISILVTVREEDFRRASISGAELQFAEIELALEGTEAQEIYKFLAETVTPSEFLNFEDAWNKFGGEGPLLEFVYLITQGALLRERLSQQVKRFEDEVRRGNYSASELELLRLVAVASAFESRLKVRPLVKHLGLPVPQRTFELLEKEYLLRRSADDSLVGGLHPIRSSILAELLTDPKFSPWSESASTCLPFIVEQDVESFLLYAFLRHKAEIEPLLHALDSYQPEQWIAISGVTRALIWLGIKEYVEASRHLIEESYKAFSNGWMLLLDLDVADVSPGAAESLLTSLGSLLPEEKQSRIEAFRSRQIDKKLVFKHVERWLPKQTRKPELPDDDVAWSGMAETLFWLGRLGIKAPVREWLSDIDLDDVVNSLPVKILSDLALGLFYGEQESYRAWIGRNYSELIRRFRQETQTIVLQDDGQTITSHFVIEMYQSDALQPGNNQKHQEAEKRLIDYAMQRLELLRGLFPNREAYACRGYGQKIWANELPFNYDDTEKNIPRSNLPIQWLVSVNSTCNTLAEQIFRPNTWEDFTNLVFGIRQAVVTSLQELKKGLEAHLRKQKTVEIFGKFVNSKAWEQCQQMLHKPPLLPRCAFDQWGFVTDRTTQALENSRLGADNRSQERLALRSNKGLALEKYSGFSKAFMDYTNLLFHFLDRASPVMVLNPHLRDRKNFKAKEISNQSDIKQTIRASIGNLGDVLKILPKFQKEFRLLLSKFIDPQKLDALERQENDTLSDVWSLWYFFALHPTRRLQNAQQECKEELNNKTKRVIKTLKKELRAISSEELQVNISSEILSWEKEPALCLTIDGKNSLDVYNSIDRVINLVREALNSIENIELRRYTLESTWSNVAIVPLVKGKSLNATAWSFPLLILLFEENQLGWWNFVPKPIPQDTLHELRITTWTLPRLEVPNKLLASVTQLSLFASHVRDFERIENLLELDEQGKEQLQQYVQHLSISISKAFQSALDAMAEMAEYFDKLPPIKQASRLNLLSAVQLLIELRDWIMPKTDFQERIRMGLEEIVHWANRLGTAQQYTFLIYLSWASDVLEEF